MTDEDLMRLADDGCPHCPEHCPRFRGIFVIRDDYTIRIGREHLEALMAGRMTSSVES